jgi:hypothetical protein
VKAASLGGDGEIAIAEPAYEVEGFAGRLLAREPHGVVGDRFLDRRSHVRHCAEEAIGGNEAVERLMRSLEVVGLNEESEPAIAISVVGEHGAREELVPERFPEALDLAERLRMLRATLDVTNAVLAERALEVGLAAPGRVLATLVGQDLARLAPSGDASRESLHDELGALMMGERVRDDEARVIVHERSEVEALLATEQEREDVGLPELIGLCALEATWRVLARGHRLMRLDEACVVEDATDLSLGDTERVEPREHVANAARAHLRVLLAEGDHRIAIGAWRWSLLLLAPVADGPERVRPADAIEAHPFGERCVRNTEGT